MIIDNFLPEENLKFLQETVMWSTTFPFNLHNDVTYGNDSDNIDSNDNDCDYVITFIMVMITIVMIITKNSDTLLI